MEGFLYINKPTGMTSHDVIDELRRITKIRKIGHAGTLDPFATGLLICGIGREATKKLDVFLKQDKEYFARLKLGFVSDTYDREGKIELKETKQRPDEKELKETLKSFQGEIEQYPPMFSAKKIKGKKLYQLARRGIKVDLKPVKIKIQQLEITKYDFPYLEIKVSCSSGTYIRSLANDIGEKLNCGAYLEELCRTKINGISLRSAVNLDELNSLNWPKFLKLDTDIFLNNNGLRTLNY
ncbi:MAG: tRNA pseudouridine(55) synthase TruB [bacterium]